VTGDHRRTEGEGFRIVGHAAIEAPALGPRNRPGPWNDFGCVKLGDSAGSLPNGTFHEAPVLSSPPNRAAFPMEQRPSCKCMQDGSYAYFSRFPQLLLPP
jgi:hypothetical protein